MVAGEEALKLLDGWTLDEPGPQDLDGGEGLAGQERGQVVFDGLYFGELRQGVYFPVALSR